jgi:hypothetical protein
MAGSTFFGCLEFGRRKYRFTPVFFFFKGISAFIFHYYPALCNTEIDQETLDNMSLRASSFINLS